MAATAAKPRDVPVRTTAKGRRGAANRRPVEEVEPRRPAPRKKLSFEEFLDWCDEDTWAEWVDGEVIVLSPATVPHQQLVTFLVFLLEFFNAAHDLGQIFTAPTLMKLGLVRAGREPDLVFVAKVHLNRLQRVFIDGPADLVVEVVSPDSTRRDRIEKFREYEAAGVPEYWILDRDHRDAAFYRLGADGRYRRVPPDAEGVFRSEALPGFWLRVDWLWQDPLPTLGAARELGLMK